MQRNSKLEIVLSLGILTVVSVTIASNVQAHLPDRNWDAASTHWYTSMALFNGWYASDWLAAGLGTWFWPPIGILLGGIRSIDTQGLAISTLTILIFAITLGCLGNITSKSFSGLKIKLSLISAVMGICALSPFWSAELGTSLQNWITLPIILYGMIQILKVINHGIRPKPLFLAGLFLGLSFALKMTNVIYLITAFVFLIYYFLKKLDIRKSSIRYVSYFIFGGFIGIVPIIPWWIYTYFKVKNPVFPFYNAIFRSPFYGTENFKDSRWVWEFPGSLLNIPSGWSLGSDVAELRTVDVRVSILFALYLVALIVRVLVAFFSSKFIVEEKLVPARSEAINFIHLWIFISTFIWILMFGYIRYWEPTEILLGIGIGACIFELFQNRKLQTFAIYSVLIISLNSFNAPNWTQASATPNLGSSIAPWSSPLTEKVKAFEGIIITSGSPTSFIRLSAPGIKHQINTDFPGIPVKFREIVKKEFESGNTLLFIAANNDDAASSLKNTLVNSFSIQEDFSLNCEVIEGPILVKYEVCTFSKFGLAD